MPFSGVDIEGTRAVELQTACLIEACLGASLVDGARCGIAAQYGSERKQRLQGMSLAVTGTCARFEVDLVKAAAAEMGVSSDPYPMQACGQAGLDKAAQDDLGLECQQQHQQVVNQPSSVPSPMQQQQQKYDMLNTAQVPAAATATIEVVYPSSITEATTACVQLSNSRGGASEPDAVDSDSSWDVMRTTAHAPSVAAANNQQLLTSVTSESLPGSQQQQQQQSSLITQYSNGSSASVKACDSGEGNSGSGGSRSAPNRSGGQGGSSGGPGGGHDSRRGSSGSAGGSSSGSGSSGGDQGDDDDRGSNRQQMRVTQHTEAADVNASDEAVEKAAAAATLGESLVSVGCSTRDPVVLPEPADPGKSPGNLRLLSSPTRFMTQAPAAAGGASVAAGPGRELSLDALAAGPLETDHNLLSMLPHELNLSAVNTTSSAVALNSLTDAGLAAAAGEGDQGLGLMQAGMFSGSHHVNPLSPAASGGEFPGFAGLSGVNVLSRTAGRRSSEVAAAAGGGGSSWGAGQQQAQQQALQQQMLLLQQQQQLGVAYPAGPYSGLNSGLDQLLYQINQGALSPAGSGSLQHLAASYNHQQRQQQQGTPIISPQHSLGIPPLPQQQQQQHRPPLLSSSGSAPFSGGRPAAVPEGYPLLSNQLHLLNPGLMGLIGSSDPGLAAAAAAAPGPLALSGSDNLMNWLSNDEFSRTGTGISLLSGAASESDAAALARAAAAFSNTAAITAAAAAAQATRREKQQQKAAAGGAVVNGGSIKVSSDGAAALDTRQGQLRDQDAAAAAAASSHKPASMSSSSNAMSESIALKQRPTAATGAEAAGQGADSAVSGDTAGGGGGGGGGESVGQAVSISITCSEKADLQSGHHAISADNHEVGQPAAGAAGDGSKTQVENSSSLAWLAAAAAARSRAAPDAGGDIMAQGQQASTAAAPTTTVAAASGTSVKSSSSIGAQLNEQLPVVVANSSSSSSVSDIKPHQDQKSAPTQQQNSSTAAAAAAAAVAAAAAAAVASGSTDSNAATAAHVAAAAAALAAVDPGAPQGPSSAAAAVDLLGGDDVDIPEGQPSRHLWLGNIPLKPNRAAMESLFSRFGPLESVRVFPGKTFAFINFVHAGHAITAKAALDGQASPLITGPKPLVIRFQKDTAAVPTAQAAAKALEAAAARARKSLGRTSLTGGGGGGGAVLFSGAAAAPGAGGSLGDEGFVTEPAINLSNKLNPNNIHYDRELAARYKRMSKSEKEALWAQDRAMQQLENNPAAASLLSAAAMAAAAAAAGQQTPAALFESVLQQQQQQSPAASLYHQIMSTNPQMAAAAALQQAHGAAAAGLFQQTPGMAAAAAAGWSRSAAYQQAAAAAHAQALGHAALNPATAAAAAATAGLGGLMGRMSGAGGQHGGGGGGGGGLPPYLAGPGDLLSHQLSNPALLQQQLMNYMSPQQDPSAALAALNLEQTGRQANVANINTAAAAAAAGGLGLGAGSFYPAAAAGGGGLPPGLAATAAAAAGLGGPHSQPGANRRVSLPGAAQATPLTATSPGQQQQQHLSGVGSIWCGGSSLVGQLHQQYLCPLTQQVMADPVVAADGFTYERSAITEWLKVQDCSPVTGQPFSSAALQPNMALRQAIAGELARLQAAAAVGL